MGTSKSQPSPSVPAWSAVSVAYETQAVPAARVAQLVWRANSADPSSDFARLLGAPEVLACLEVARTSETALAAIEAINSQPARERTIAIDIAKRAALRAYAGKDRAQAFVSNLFVEATNYLVSRDLSGLVGRSEFLATARAAKTRKNDVLAAVADAAASQITANAIGTRKEWRRIISEICKDLRR